MSTPSQSDFGDPAKTELDAFIEIVEAMIHDHREYERTKSTNKRQIAKRSEMKVEAWIAKHREPQSRLF